MDDRESKKGSAQLLIPSLVEGRVRPRSHRTTTEGRGVLDARHGTWRELFAAVDRVARLTGDT